MSLPPIPDPRDEVDDLYRKASALDPSRPGEAVRRRVLEHATQLAAERAGRSASASVRAGAMPHHAPRWWRPAAMSGTLAAAVIAGLMIAPRFLMSPGAPTSRAPMTAAVQAERPESRLSAPATAPALQEEVVAAPEPPVVAPAQPAAHEGLPQPQSAREASREELAAADSQQATVTGARRAAMAPAAANVTDAAAAFRHAAENGDLHALDRLLAGQSDINARDAAGRTPLMLAVLHGQTEVVSALLAYGADPNAADAHGTTPLEAARASGRPAIIAALQRYGARR
jgi:hypothetical protein